ncbi:MAG: DNA-binding protein [Solirubrobacterales bacterium]|jgi:transcriptional regulator with XRE-family HTH domain|nr:DNA-binding protein [Solirubrobacterales bacterium]
MTEDPWKEQLRLLGEFIRAQRGMARLSLRQLGELTGVSNAYLSQLERGLHEPSLSILKSISDALGMPLESLLAQTGMLPDVAPGDTAVIPDTETAILQDPQLSEPQRVALLSVYRSFVPARRRG